VATLIDRSWSQSCKKEEISWIENGIEIRDCDSVSYKKLIQNFHSEKNEKIFAGDKNNSFPVIDDRFFNKSKNLVGLWLSQCDIETVEENAFSNLKVLSVLDLSSNKIKNLHKNTFRELANLTEILLYRNQIETIPEKLFEGNGKLKELQMQKNKIKKIPIGVFDALTELKWLLMGANELVIIHRSTFEQNKKLEKLWLSNNKINGISKGTFETLKNLTYLDLANNACINKRYSSRSPINLDQVSSDLRKCYENYETISTMTVSTFLSTNLETTAEVSTTGSIQASDTSTETAKISKRNSSELPTLVLVSISTILSVTGVIAIFTFIQKTKKVFKELKERQEFEMKQRESFHYYSQPDTPAQIEHAQWQELEREMKSE
jgi:Leucine-rich repeat (LRR) protein